MRLLLETLSHTISVPEVLRNFYRSRNKHITLQQNAQFYLNLPTSADSYEAEFRAFPLPEYFRIEPGTTVSVLVDRPRREFSRKLVRS